MIIMFKLFNKKVNVTSEQFKRKLEDNINNDDSFNIIKLWCLVKWCDYNKSCYCYYHHFIEKQRKEWSKKLFNVMWEFCKIKVKNKSDIIHDVFIKNYNLNNQDNIKQIITDIFKKYNIDNDINLISIACANSIEGICKALDFEFDNHLDNYINDMLG